ncbi:MAG: hypothetical protein FJZ00_00220 [Candidatus Sericytochromatia bacterium]|uniref:Uncharacterized protein n=1 Tax=Candidatus Tanganyikabacteria bacterium TaxID=2961651 RepID=A0A938BM43_9BACT|nr:hypothetical protein [Candidatus Tanganyikabacteria bacterium]
MSRFLDIWLWSIVALAVAALIGGPLYALLFVEDGWIFMFPKPPMPE